MTDNGNGLYTRETLARTDVSARTPSGRLRRWWSSMVSWKIRSIWGIFHVQFHGQLKDQKLLCKLLIHPPLPQRCQVRSQRTPCSQTVIQTLNMKKTTRPLLLDLHLRGPLRFTLLETKLVDPKSGSNMKPCLSCSPARRGMTTQSSPNIHYTRRPSGFLYRFTFTK